MDQEGQDSAVVKPSKPRLVSARAQAGGCPVGEWGPAEVVSAVVQVAAEEAGVSVEDPAAECGREVARQAAPAGNDWLR